MTSQKLPDEPASDGPPDRAVRPAFEPPLPTLPPAQPTPEQPRARDHRHPGPATLTAVIVAAAVVLTVAFNGGGLRVAIRDPHERAPAAATAMDAVRGYLEALAVGDATTALTYGVSPPADPRLLTDDVLAESLETNRMGGIDVLDGTGSDTRQTVPALYRVGDRGVRASFDVQRIGERWLLSSVSTQADLSRIKARALGLSLNGVALATDTPELFLGTYTLTTPDYRFAIFSATFFVESYRTNPNTAEITMGLGDKGVDAIRRAAQSKLTDCLKTKSLVPSGCGFRAIPTAGAPRANSIGWTVTRGARELQSMDVALVRDDPTTVRSKVRIDLRATYTATDGSVGRATTTIAEVFVTLLNCTTEIAFVGPN